ncbi:nucleoside phosphorylase-I family protein [Gehongia tenuis]|uniref:Nucleoside phosphorylase domain-containing protein n=1 Tax=Gehongia tenuis TaxID=2763655 RepID=A0A926D2Z4_9FIRM|nr:hypothetical protein [Gehongia tenuis]MBC8530397.1 hypothetical protein [Gehongia tenuis]
MLLITCALPLEAAPLKRRLKLSRLPGPYFMAAGEKAALIVSGPGRYEAAAAAAYLACAVRPGEDALFANLGLAGGEGYAVGDVVLASPVGAPGEADLYPEMLYAHPFKTGRMLTHGRPVQKALGETVLVDMEGYGFAKTALRLAGPQNTVLIKIVSDVLGRGLPNRSQAEDLAERLAESALPFLTELDEAVSARALTASERDGLFALAEAARFTESQRQQLIRAARIHKGRRGVLPSLPTPGKEERRDYLLRLLAALRS